MLRVRSLVGAAMTSTLVVACNLLTGVGNLEIGADDASAPLGTSDSGFDAGASDGSNVADANVVVDTGPPPACPSAGHSCLQAPPAGWDGPFLIYVGDEAGAPTCPTEMPVSVDAPTGDATGAFTCECRCGGVTNAKCTAFLDEFNGAGCVDPPAGREDLATCHTPGGDASFRASLDLTSAGSCAPSATFKSKADPAFATVMRLCHRPTAFTADGCAATELCVPNGAPPFKSKACIVNDDESQACPAPWTDAYRIYDGVSDTRACNNGSCACDVPTGVTCTARMRNYTASTVCGGAYTNMDLPVTTCVNVAANTSQKGIGLPNAVGGSCNAKGVPAAAGSVAGNGGAIVCCAP